MKPDLERAITRVFERIMSLPPAVDRDVVVEAAIWIEMDDGVELVADLYTPAGAGPHPTVLVRTPYGRGSFNGLLFGRVFAERGYRVLLQSCRGTFGSGGSFEPNFNERADGLATIGWIERQPWFDGRLAMNGPSYLGGVQWAVADAAGPSLRALCTHVTYSNITRHWYRGGSFSFEDAIEWTTLINEQEFGLRKKARGLVPGRERRIDRVIDQLPVGSMDQRVLGHRVDFWQDFVDHPSTDDPYWAPLDHSERVAAVEAPVLQVGGWYDIFLPNQIEDYRTLVAAGRQPRLVIGPWVHASPRGFYAQLNETFAWLDRHLRDDQPAGRRRQRSPGKPVRLFVMGAGEWRDVESWPPPGYAPQRWHLHPGGRLDVATPSSGNGLATCYAYTYDPADPTPIAGGTLLRRSGGGRDQAHTEGRPDVAVFTSRVLTSDVEVIGEVSAEIYVASDLEHFDVFVRLCDVDANGRSTNVCDGLERVSPSRWPRPADGLWRVPVSLWPTAQRFLAGHQIRLQVSSGAHPRFIRNLGTDEPMASGTTMRVAHQTIIFDADHPSAVVLPVGVSTT